MRLSFTKDRFNFHEVLERIRSARRVIIATYCIDTEADGALMKNVRARLAGGSTTIITNIPQRFDQYYSGPARARAARNIDAYVEGLTPGKFACLPEVWFCFRNHAKIILCDDWLYIGSANFSIASMANFEAGCITREAAHVAEAEEFLAKMKADAIPYWNANTPELRRFVTLAAAIPTLVEDATDLVCDLVPDGSGDYVQEFRMDRFALLPSLVESLDEAKSAADTMEGRQGDDGASAAEDRFIAAGGTRLVGDLHEEMASLIEGSDWPELISEKALAADLFEKYGHVSNDGNPDEIHAAFQEELEATLSKNAKQREEAARKQLSGFLKRVKKLRTKVLAAFHAAGANPEVDNSA
jgi:hypothetical protein